MIVSKRGLEERIHEECPEVAGVYDGILEGSLMLKLCLIRYMVSGIGWRGVFLL